MNHFLRPYTRFGIIALAGLSMASVAGPPGLEAQSTQVLELLEGTSPLLLLHSNSQGYLGAYVEDLDADKAQTLKLKEVRGAVITLIDHDAPAGQIGLRVNDVVLQLNGQNVEGAEQLRRLLKEIPPGRKVSLEFSRDGNVQTTSVELADRRAMEHDVWNKLGKQSDTFAASPGMGVLSGSGDGSLPGMFHMPIFGSTLNVGAIVEPLTGQMAEYLGVPSGLMVKQVAHKSEASAAGFKAFDVILKVGPDAVTTLSDWDRALRANQGKPVQVTILRDRKQQTLNLQVDSKHKTGALELEPLVPSGDGAEMAELEGGLQAFGPSAQEWAQELLGQAQGMENEAKELGNQIQTLHNSDSFQLDNFKISQKQIDDLKQQIDRFEKGFKAEDFKVDPALADELRKQAEALGDPLKMQDFKMEDFKIDQKQLDDLKQQMDQFRDMLRPQELRGTGVTGPPV